MPRGKKNEVIQVSSDEVPHSKTLTKIQNVLWQVRELCRGRNLQVWHQQSLANQIYQDLLFIYHIPSLCSQGVLTLDANYISDGKFNEISYSSFLTLKEPQLINDSFKRLWKELQRSEMKQLFEGRKFTLFDIETKKPKPYIDLLLDLFKYFASIEIQSYSSNEGYTYFKKDLNKAIAKTFGQFYTPPTVTSSVVKLLKPKSSESVLDPSCGSCSFLAEVASFISRNENLEIKNAFQNLYGYEVESNIYAEGIMNMFINFGVVPNMENNIREVDALVEMVKDDIVFDKSAANPPFGADAKSFQEFYFKTEIESVGKRTKKIEVVNPEVKVRIPYPKVSESAVLFFQLIVQKLKPMGEAGVVMSATIFNDAYKDVMKWFLESCALHTIVINPAGTFKEQGTGIETFSLMFTKGKPTTEVNIVMLGEEEKIVRTLTIDQIKAAGWKIQLKEEEKKDTYKGEYEKKHLHDILTVCFGERITKKEHAGTQYPVYGSGLDTFLTDRFNREGKTCKIGRFALSEENMVVLLNEKYWLMDSGFTVNSKDKSLVLDEFIWYYLLCDKKRLASCSSGSCQQNINMEKFYKVEYSIPPVPVQKQIIASLDRILADIQDGKDCLAFTSNAMDLMLKDPTGKLLEDVLLGLRLKRTYLSAEESVKQQMAAVIRSVNARGYEKKKLADICEFNKGITKHDTEFGKDSGNYPFYTGASNNKLYTDLPDIHHRVIIMNRTNGAGKCNLFIDKDCSVAGQTLVFYMKDKDEVSLRYLYNYLQTFKVRVEEGYVGSNHKNISNAFMEAFEVELPPLPIQKEVLAILNEMEAERKRLEQMASKAEERARFVLEGYLSQATQTEVVEPIVEQLPETQSEVTQNQTVQSVPKKRKIKISNAVLNAAT